MSSTVEDILAQLQQVKRAGEGWVAKCPGHEDRHASLSIGEGSDGTVLLKCHAGCSFEQIASKLVWDKTRDDAAPPARSDRRGTILEEYDYVDENGALLFQTLRFDPKDFRQRVKRPDGSWEWRLGDTRRVLFRLPDVLSAKEEGRRVFLVEGERDVLTLETHGFVATTNPMGAGKWRDEYSEQLRGAHVVILPDNDEPGENHAKRVSEALEGVAASVTIVRLPDLDAKGDVTDWFRGGGTSQALKALVKAPRELPGDVVTLTSALEWVGKFSEQPLPPGIEYPWAPITRLTRGMRDGWLCVLAGYPSHGKTAAAIEITTTAAKHGARVLFVSIEMNSEEVGVRVVQKWGLDSQGFYLPNPSDRTKENNREAVEVAFGMVAHKRVFLTHTNKLERIEELVSQLRPDLVVVDYLGLLDIGRADRREGTTRNSHGLKMLARKYAVPVLCLVQLRREHPGQAPAPPSLNDLKDSSAIEQDADQVVFVYRDREKESRTIETSGAFIVAKSRMGRLGMAKFEFDGDRQIFTLLASEAQQRAHNIGLEVLAGELE